MKTPHKHAELIHAWADGAIIQCKSTIKAGCEWFTPSGPSWSPELAYRIKPTPKPDVIEHRHLQRGCVSFPEPHDKPNVQITFDGETGHLKLVEMLK